MKKLVTREELGNLLGVSGKRNFQLWEQSGLPFQSKQGKGGRPRHLYDLDAALEWLNRNGSEAISSRVRQILRGMDGRSAVVEETAATPPPTGGGDTADAPGLAGALARTEAVEVRLYGLEMEAMNRGEIQRAALLERHRLAAARGLAELKEQLRGQMLEEDKLCVREELEGLYLKQTESAKNNVLGVPDAVIPHLLPFMRDPNDAPKIREIIYGMTTDALRSVWKPDAGWEEQIAPKIGS